LAKLKKRMNKRGIFLALVSIVGIIALFVNLTVTIYRSNLHGSEMSFKNDAISRTSGIRRNFQDMETILSVFISTVETMRNNNITDRALIIQMQMEMLNKHTDAFGISIVYEPYAYDGLDEAYSDDLLYSENGIFAVDIRRADGEYSVEPYFSIHGFDVYENVRSSEFCFLHTGAYDTATWPVTVFSLNSPIYDQNGNFIGMASLTYTADFLESNLDAHMGNEITSLIVTENRGNVIASSPRLEETTDKDILSLVSNMNRISSDSLHEVQMFQTHGMFKDNLMVFTDIVSFHKEHSFLSELSRLNIIHMAKKQTFWNYLIVRGFTNVNFIIASVAIAAFIALISDFLIRRRKDALTGAYCRDVIENDLPAIISEAVAAKKDTCLIMTDIDHFKTVNDTYGHAAGDEVLKDFTNIIQQCIRSNDWVARYGGEEFLILLPDTNIETGRTVAERIRNKLEESTVSADDNSIKVTASFGVASLISDGVASAEKIIKLADERLYSAKASGRNQVQGN